MQSRSQLEFAAESTEPAVIDECRKAHGAVLLRGAVPALPLQEIRRYAGLYADEMREAIRIGHTSYFTWMFEQERITMPWEATARGVPFLASLLRTMILSPLWRHLETALDSSKIAVPLNVVYLRRVVDRVDAADSLPRGLGRFRQPHQDATVVHHDYPVTTWVALEPIASGQKSALAIWPIKNDVVYDVSALRQFVEDNAESIWRPSYEVGDVMLFDSTTPHCTALYGSGQERFSVELRYCDAERIPAAYADCCPFLIVESKDVPGDPGRRTYSIGQRNIAEIIDGTIPCGITTVGLPLFARSMLNTGWQLPPLPAAQGASGA
jgi:hypothetical protein